MSAAPQPAATDTDANPVGAQRTGAQQLAADGARFADTVDSGSLGRVDVSRAVLGWARDTLGPDLVALSSMADEAMVHLAGQVIPGLDVAFLDTGRHFGETLEIRDTMAANLDINLINVQPLVTVVEQDKRFGPDLHLRDPDRCCQLRKLEPLNRILGNYGGWITGVRRVDAATRATTELVEYDARRDMVKINPLAHWDDADLAAYVTEFAVPQHPLRSLGYPSIGCEPCTKRPEPGDDPRSGRWAGSGKTECGLHL